MEKINKLMDDEINDLLSKLNNWIVRDKKLYKIYKFKNFNQAIAFIVSVGMECEKMNHHPEWSNVYNLIKVELTTHRVAGLTELDFKLAKIMDDIFNGFRDNSN